MQHARQETATLKFKLEFSFLEIQQLNLNDPVDEQSRYLEYGRSYRCREEAILKI